MQNAAISAACSSARRRAICASPRIPGASRWSSPSAAATPAAETKEGKAEAARQTEQPECQAVFAGQVGEVSYTELVQLIITRAHLSVATAKRRIPKWLSIGLLKHGPTGGYYRA